MAFLTFLLLAVVLRPVWRLLDIAMPDGPHATQGFRTPVIGGLALWGAIAAAWWWRPDDVDLPAIILGLLALRLLAAPADRGLGWTNIAMLLVDVIVCAAIVQQRQGNALELDDILATLGGVAVLQGVYRLRSLDGLGAMVLCIALSALSFMTAGTAHWLSATGAAAAAGLLALNLPFRINRAFRIQSGQGGTALLALLFGIAALQMDADGSDSGLTPMHLLWLMPLPFCELLRLAAGQQTSHERLLGAGFSVTAIFILYAVMTLLPAIALIAAPSLPPPLLLLVIFAALVGIWFAVVRQAPRLMWLLPWQMRRIDVIHKD
ncbi:MAG: hypothetical protein RLZZ200_2154 [Pseudomonadota bacterium]|jgi:hypothetical protein